MNEFGEFNSLLYSLIKKAIGTFYFSTGYFIKKNKNILYCVPIRYKKQSWKFGRTWNTRNTSHFNFSFSQNFHSYCYNCTAHNELFKREICLVNVRVAPRSSVNFPAGHLQGDILLTPIPVPVGHWVSLTRQ